MAAGQISISMKGEMGDVLQSARKAYPTAKNDAQALTLFILEMHRSYQGRDRLEADVAEMKKTLRYLMETLTPGK